MRCGDHGIFPGSHRDRRVRTTPTIPTVTSRQADILGSEQTPGDRWKLPITSHVTQVISKTLIKTKDANCTRLCCLCCGSVMASTLPWARSLLLHRGCFALSCLFSSYWGFWQDSCCLLRVVEQEGVLQCCPRAAGHGQVNAPHAREKSHSTQRCCPPHQWHPGARARGLCGSVAPAGAVGTWSKHGSGSLDHSWEGVPMGQGQPDPRALGEPLQPRRVLKETVPAYEYLQKQTLGRWEKEGARH